jgi:NADH dehydrogenase
MTETRTIVIIGGGFAGTTLARELDGRLPAGWQLLLISEESYTTFNPLLPEALGASIFPEQVVAPIRQMLTRGRFIMGRVTAIDPAAKMLICTTLAGETRVAYEHLVLAFGSRARLDLIPGFLNTRCR